MNRTKPGAHGTLTLYRFTIASNYPEGDGCGPYVVTRWAYSLDHAWRRAVEELEDDTTYGDRVIGVSAVAA